MTPGERRYYRQSVAEGLEVLLLRRILGSRWWVLLPDLTMRPVMTSHRRTVAATPVAAVTYGALPVRSEEQRRVYIQQANDAVAQGQDGVDLPLYVPGGQLQRAVAAQAVSTALAMPARLRALLRWGLRSRARSIALLLSCVLLYEACEIMGVFSTW